ncbi:MAG: hypothetical protein ACI4CA_10235 [Bacteroides sp.]
MAQKIGTDDLLVFNSPHYWISCTSLDLYAITPSERISNITYNGEISKQVM